MTTVGENKIAPEATLTITCYDILFDPHGQGSRADCLDMDFRTVPFTSESASFPSARIEIHLIHLCFTKYVTKLLIAFLELSYSILFNSNHYYSA